MFGSTVLEVAIGLVFLFFILSLLVSAAREILEGWLQQRSTHLQQGLRELLRDPHGNELVKQVYDHPMISSLFRGHYDPAKLRNLPSYIPARNFALALLDIAARGDPAKTAVPANTPTAVDYAEVRAGVAKHIRDPILQRAVLVSLDNAKGDLDKARVSLQAWYDSSMDRVSGWYRKRTQWILVGLGFAAAVVLNIDSVGIVKYLYENEAARSLIIAEAQASVERAKAAPEPGSAAQREAIGCPGALKPTEIAAGKTCYQKRLENLGYPIGWSREEWPGTPDWGGIPPWSEFPWHHLLGWLLTAVAVSLGAPFWFDLLNKMMVIRSTVKPHEKSKEEGSEDRQTGVKSGSANAG